MGGVSFIDYYYFLKYTHICLCLVFLHYTLIVIMLVFLLQLGDFELDLTSYLCYKCITVVSTIIAPSYVWQVVYFVFPSALTSGGERIQSITCYLICRY